MVQGSTDKHALSRTPTHTSIASSREMEMFVELCAVYAQGVK